MDPTAFVARLRDHYVDQFRRFAEQQRSSCGRGAAEVKLRLSDDSDLFAQLYCADFIRNDAAQEVIELRPESVLTFEPISGTFGDASLLIDHLHWDDVLIRHDLASLPSDLLGEWFAFWFDLEDARHDPDAELSGTIHSVTVAATSIVVDFGTAAPDAFWDLLQLLADAGVSRLEVTSSEAADAEAA